MIRSPKAPTKAEKEEHEANHLPFRSWCTHSLRGRGRNKPHQRQTVDAEADDNRVPKISMDYFFMSQDDEKASENPLLLMVDVPNAVAEPTVPQRGEDQSRRAYLKKRDFEKFGYDEDCEGCKRLMANMAPRPHKDTCRARMENHLEKEENPRWKKAADAKEE